MYALGAIDGDGATFNLLVDTGSVLSTRGAPVTAAPRLGLHTLRLYDRPPSGNPVERAAFADAQILETPLGGVGVGGDLLAVGGVLGGDLLHQFSVRLHYGSAPTLSLLPGELACSCALADACQVVLPFTLAGGGTLALGEDVYTYPATRVTVDACLEPVTDPIRRGVACVDGARGVLGDGYAPDGGPGVDVRFLVATGFPGVLLGASAYDRMCGRPDRAARHARLCQGGPAATLFATAAATPGAEVELHFASPTATTRAVRVTLGDPCAAPSPLAALALVGREGLLSPCGELARSRRLRASPPSPGSCDRDDRPPPGALTCLLRLSRGGNEMCGDPDRCTDANQPAAGFLELDEPLPVYVVPDGAPVLQEVNFDVRPGLSDIEGLVGSELLARLEAQIDYPAGRIIARCGCAAGCTAYPRFACPTGNVAVGDCGVRGQTASELCNPPSSIPVGAGAALCLPAPVLVSGAGQDGGSGAVACDPAPGPVTCGGGSDGSGSPGDGGGPARDGGASDGLATFVDGGGASG